VNIMDKRAFYDQAVLAMLPAAVTSKTVLRPVEDVAAEVSALAQALIAERDRFLAKQPLGHPLYPKKVSE